MKNTLYSPAYEHDACGVGLVARLDGVPTHDIVTSGLTVLKRLMHRGATGNDPDTGDGAGLLLRIPDAFFRAAIPSLPPAGTYGVAMLFGGVGDESALEAAAAAEGFDVLAWRDVPVNPSAIGPVARAALPRIRQLFLAPDPAAPAGRPSVGQETAAPFSPALERRLLVLRRQLERAAPSAYICSCSARTVVYKGLLLATQIDHFYPDLADPAFASPFAIVHQRYSTNTFPSWPLAHPFRALAHNGEINALRGNLAALSAREPSLASPLFGDDLQKLLPVVLPEQSDSASLDNIFELLVAAGRDAPHAMLMLIPQAWGAKYHMPHDVRAFCEYHSALMEPWDGPAAIAFTDGLSLGAALDRNGLRPARWTLTRDGLFVLASEAGVLDIPPADVARHGRLAPGSILWIDLAAHRLREDAELKAHYARRRPYRRWIAQNHIPVTGLFTEVVPSPVPTDLPALQHNFGWTLEDTETILRPMLETGTEPVGAMGNDAALACLDPSPRTLFDHFHQLFAQVTNPPIDPIREELVMSIMTYIGNLPNILAETPAHARLLKLTRPVLTDDELRRLRSVPEYPAATLSLHFDGPLRPALDARAAAALSAVRAGKKILILSDRPAPDAPPRRLPSLLAVAAVHKTLSDAGLRPSIGLIVDSGEIREVHHLSVLLGFGATAACPWLALSTVTALAPDAPHRAAANYVAALCRGLMKTMSKMGISTLRSYRNARIYQAIGLGPTLLRDYFGSIPSPVSGLELPDLDRRLPRSPGGAGDPPASGGSRSCATAGGAGAEPPSLAPTSLPPGSLYPFRQNATPHLW
ncbi:MAG: glutamate synthase subunit alpha, partial [Kiritimatiellae bacterium]|nr:glutamate synthase subunit alpha [Kiritimatiellia bacterium]